MNMFLLTMVGTLLINILQSDTAQGGAGALTRLRTLYPRMLAKQQAQELATTELDKVSAAALRKISIVLPGMPVPEAPQRFGQALPPLTQAMVMLHEQEALLKSLLGSSYETREALRNLIKLGGEGVIVVTHNDYNEQTPLNLDRRTFSNAIDFYSESTLAMLEKPAILFVGGKKNMLNLIGIDKELEKHGMPPRTLLDRITHRERNGGRELALALQELSQAGNSPYPTALVHTIAKDIGFNTQIEALAKPLLADNAEPIADDLEPLPESIREAMALPGIETKAKIFELAARIAAIKSDLKALYANLRRILDLNNNTDYVQMTVSLRGRKKVLSEDNLHAVQQLYRQVFAQPSLNH